MPLNLENLLCGDTVRLRYVRRWGVCRVSQPESVAEHSYYVALYCMIIGRWYNDRQFPPGEGIRLLNMELLLSRALFHDVEEAKTGDIPRPFKDESSYVASTLKAAGSRAFFKIIRDIVVTPDASVAAQHLWTDSKDTNTAEGCLLNFADFLSALSFLLQESLEHNATVWEHIDPMCNYFNTFRRQEYDFIRPIIDQVPPLMDRIFKGRQAERRYRP